MRPLSLLTHNILSAMKSLALPVEFHTARPKLLRFLVFALAGRIVSHAGRLVLRIALEADNRSGFREARRRLASMAPGVPKRQEPPIAPLAGLSPRPRAPPSALREARDGNRKP